MVVCCWVDICGRGRLGGRAVSVSCVGRVLLGVCLFRCRLRDVVGGGAGVVVVRCFSSRRLDLRVGLSLSGL